MIRVRRASIQDIKQLIKLSMLYGEERVEDNIWRAKQDKRLLTEEIRQYIKDNNSYLLVVEENKKIVGFFKAIIFEMEKIMKTKKICSLKELYVMPECRGKKIASKLMKKMCGLARKKTNVFTFHVLPNNTKAIAIYKKWGFKPSYICMTKRF